ncbi:MAG: hypothetical protein II630_08195, partial [Bacteroidales bacterium]|nr:hypothetical protein [Bacteroidales bacterium]
LSIQNSASQNTQRYTDEIRKQAAAIRATKEWQEKGYYRIGEASFYNPETSRLAKKDIISLEEQILRWKQKQTEETDKTTRSEYQYSEAVRSAADALRAQLHGTKAASIEVGGRTIYNEKEAGSIESQLTALMKDRTKEFNLQHEVALAIEQDEKRISEELLKQRQTSDGAKKTKEAETYRQMIAKTLGIQESQVKLANAETASYEQLDATLKQLIRTKNRLGSEGLNSAFGKGLLEDIKEVEAAMQRIKKFGYNKVSLSNALGLSEKSLDDIARKSQQLQYVMRNVDTTTEEGALAFQRASLNARLLKERENELLGKNNQLINSNNSLIKSNTDLGRSWNYMKNRLAFYFTVGASTQFVKNLIDIRSQYEMNERALGILVNSAERGTQIFNELSKMALVSPYTLIELSSAAKQLTAYDVAAKDVVDTTRRLADMASAVGVPMERLTYALGQIKAYGYLNSRDNRMFANAGIPLVKQLADYYTELEGRLVSTADVYDRIKKKAVGYNEVMDVINRMTDEGGRFFNFQEKMSGTLKVQLANLTLAWNNMLNEIGASQQGVLTTGIGAMKNLFLAWKDLGNVLTTVALTFGLVRAQMLFANVAIGKSNVDLLRYIANNKAATWADYTRALQTKKLTAAQASWLVMSNQTNNALAASVIRMKVLDAATVRSIRNLNGLSLAFAKLRLGGIMTLAGISKAFRSLGGILAANAPLLFITGIIDAFTHLNNVADANKDFNKNIANGAKEASKALSDFLKEEDKVQARAKAQSNNLSQSEASKTWDALREQIELSSLSAKQLIPDLLKIPDIN